MRLTARALHVASVFSSSSSAASVSRVVVRGTNGADFEESVGGTIGGADGSSFVAVVFVGGVVVAVATSGFDVTSIDVFFSVLFSVIFFSAFALFFLLVLLLSVLARDLPKELPAKTDPSIFFLLGAMFGFDRVRFPSPVIQFIAHVISSGPLARSMFLQRPSGNLVGTS